MSKTSVTLNQGLKQLGVGPGPIDSRSGKGVRTFRMLIRKQSDGRSVCVLIHWAVIEITKSDDGGFSGQFL